MLLTKMMAGSLTGSALTGMVTCVSQSPRNGEESYLSLKYGAEMANFKPNRNRHLDPDPNLNPH